MATGRRQWFHSDAAELRTDRNAIAGSLLFDHAVLFVDDRTKERDWLLDVVEQYIFCAWHGKIERWITVFGQEVDVLGLLDDGVATQLLIPNDQNGVAILTRVDANAFL